jgi:hypothetical protein
MSTTWFRLYAEAVDDEKLRLLAFEDRWHYVALLCCQAQGLLDPDDPLMLRKVAVKLGLQVTEAEKAVARLAEVGLIDPDTLHPLGWEKRQYLSDTSTDRVRKYRDKKRSETLQQRSETVSVTPPDTDTDTDITPKSPFGADAPKGTFSSETQTPRETGTNPRAKGRNPRAKADRPTPRERINLCDDRAVAAAFRQHFGKDPPPGKTLEECRTLFWQRYREAS